MTSNLQPNVSGVRGRVRRSACIVQANGSGMLDANLDRPGFVEVGAMSVKVVPQSCHDTRMLMGGS